MSKANTARSDACARLNWRGGNLLIGQRVAPDPTDRKTLGCAVRLNRGMTCSPALWMEPQQDLQKAGDNLFSFSKAQREIRKLLK